MNKWDEMREAFSEAKTQVTAADAVVCQMAEMIAGRLQLLSHWMLLRLKRELSRYNATTRKWRP